MSGVVVISPGATPGGLGVSGLGSQATQGPKLLGARALECGPGHSRCTKYGGGR